MTHSSMTDEGKDNTDEVYKVHTEHELEWIEKFDETYNLYYYLNSVTGECQWDSPFAEEAAEAEETTAHDNSLDHNQNFDFQSEERVHYAENIQGMHSEKEQEGAARYALPTSTYTQAWNEYYANEEHPIYYEQDVEHHDEPHTREEHFYEEDYDFDEAADQYEELEPYDEEAAPAAVKNRSKDLLVGGSNQDYVHMARMYKLTRPYSDPNYFGLCVLCHTNFADMVFFPCEHRCLCMECIQKEHICSDIQMDSVSDGYCNCSLCAGIIKLILPSEGGAEVAKYWNWVYEEPVPLPVNFLRNFRHSAGVIKAVHVRTGDLKQVDSFENASKSCTIS